MRKNNNIELELRAEVSSKQFTDMLKKLKQQTKLISCTKRLSAMFLGKINKSNFDIRVRISSNKKAEMVVKKGYFHTHDRTESSQEINKGQFIGIVKILSLFNFKSKITERENFVFDFGDNIYLTMVKAGNIFYAEIEKMSNEEEKREDKNKLLKIFSNLNLNFIKDEKEFNNLCSRLSNDSDWAFNCSKEHLKKLNNMLLVY